MREWFPIRNWEEGEPMKKRVAAIAAVGAMVVAGVGAPAASAQPPSNACGGLGKAIFHASVSHGNLAALQRLFMEACS
jgi:hypothetical protein